MDSNTAATATTTDTSAAVKRKAEPLPGAPAAKAVKTSNQLSINYLARQSPEDLPLINKDDNLPNLLHLLSAYSNILDRHESLASNLGARPLGPILIKRFERCFDAPPNVVASHQRNSSNADDGPASHQITWLEVIEFARSHPGQFTLSTFSEGRRVCQFYYPQKQLRVQISEEDFLFINSGRCQELIPPLPIWEDEEKEVGTCDVLEAKLKELTNAADMVAARTRQLSHRLKGRRAAILERRAEGGSGTPAKANAPQTTTAHPTASTPSSSGFIAVNAASERPPADNTEVTLGSNAAVRNELLRHFESLPHNQTQGWSHSRHTSTVGATDAIYNGKSTELGGSARQDGAVSNTSSLSPVPPTLSTGETLQQASIENSRPSVAAQGHRPSSSTGNIFANGQSSLKHNFSRPLPPALESSQPFRPLCQAHMDSLPRGQRVLPPCDRCRRLRMDCVKNLTSCAGCTRKHARCHWRDVSRDELGALDHLMDSAYAAPAAYSPSRTDTTHLNGYVNGDSENGDHHQDDSEDDDSNPLEDLEALGEKEEQENQNREDEEGLRNARELARQGWEDSVRSATEVSASTEVAAQQPKIEESADEPSAETKVSDESSKEDMPHGNSGRDHDPGRVESTTASGEPGLKGQSTTNEQPALQAGFRAVNESMNGGASAPVLVQATGWRAID